MHQFAGGRRVLPAAERGLRIQRVAEPLIGDDRQHGIVAQTIGVVDVFVSGDDLRCVAAAVPASHGHPVVLARIAQWRGQSRVR